MREYNTIYGGEMSVHHYYCDSGMSLFLLLLELLEERTARV